MDKCFSPVLTNDLIGLVISYSYVFAVIGLATFFRSKKLLSSEGSRKFIHIASANWWILAMALFDSNITASIGPFTFVFINYFSFKKRWFMAMEREGGKEDMGTVYYAISLFNREAQRPARVIPPERPLHIGFHHRILFDLRQK